MTFFNDKILTIRNRIDHLLPSIGTNTLSTTEVSETAENPTNYLDSFSLITLDQLTKLISGSKPTTCILDPIPTKLLKEILPLINSTLLNTINLSLSSGYLGSPVADLVCPRPACLVSALDITSAFCLRPRVSPIPSWLHTAHHWTCLPAR